MLIIFSTFLVNAEEDQYSLTLPHSTAEVKAKISTVGSDSILVAWNASQPVSIGLSFRPFGRSAVRKLTLPYKYKGDFIVDHLVPNSGYVFCLSSLSDPNKNEEEIIQSSTKTSVVLPPFINYPLRNPSVHLPPPSRNSFAYSSTGELISLPPNQWRPRRDISQSNEQCQEIFTDFGFSSLLSPLNITIAAIVFCCIVGLIIAAFMKYRKIKPSKTQEETIRPSLQSKIELNVSPKKPQEFHPGYDIPPSSVIEAYGYDFPKKYPSYDAFKRSKGNIKKESMEKTSQNIGDIVVTGGTLIEIPEGYVHPRSRNDVLRILVEGEPTIV